MLVSGARNFATGVKNRRQKPTPVFWCLFLVPVSGWCVFGIRVDIKLAFMHVCHDAWVKYSQQKLGDQTIDKWFVSSATPYCHSP